MATKSPLVVVRVTAHTLSLSSSTSAREFESVGADVAARLVGGDLPGAVAGGIERVLLLWVHCWILILWALTALVVNSGSISK